MLGAISLPPAAALRREWVARQENDPVLWLQDHPGTGNMMRSRRNDAMRYLVSGPAVLVLALLAIGGPIDLSAQGDVITRGAALGQSPVVDLAEALAAVDAYADQTVIVEGSVNRVCQMKGCWMELVPESHDRGIRVTFKDYAFFVPTDSTGYEARLEGMFETNLFSEEDADHLIAEGVDLTRNPDGTATEVSFVAQGVELRK